MLVRLLVLGQTPCVCHNFQGTFLVDFFFFYSFSLAAPGYDGVATVGLYPRLAAPAYVICVCVRVLRCSCRLQWSTSVERSAGDGCAPLLLELIVVHYQGGGLVAGVSLAVEVGNIFCDPG